MGAVVGPGRREAHAQVQLSWTEPALHDLAAARAWIAADRPGAAQGQWDLVMAAVGRLQLFPEMGRAGRRSGTRELVVAGTPFIVPYRVGPQSIVILRVLHGRRRWPA